MIILYGTRYKVKVDSSLGTGKCENCHHNVEKALAKEKGAFTLFYIPIFGWTRSRFVLCPCCGESKKLTKAEYKELKNR